MNKTHKIQLKYKNEKSSYFLLLELLVFVCVAAAMTFYQISIKKGNNVSATKEVGPSFFIIRRLLLYLQIDKKQK